jgi:predicted ribosomally synthesized peptide with SipW-like signal peptide
MKDKSGFNYLIAPIVSIIAFLLLIGSASYAYFTQSVGSATGAANITNANLTVPRGCTFIANATNCVITANNATTTAFTDSVITRAEMSQKYAGNSVAKATCTLNIGVQGTAGCKCNYTVSLAGSEPIDYLYDSMFLNV